MNAPIHPDTATAEREAPSARMSPELRAEIAEELRASMKAAAWALSIRTRIIADSLDLRDDVGLAYAIGCANVEMRAMTNALKSLLALKGDGGGHG
jgi:hypothetical protein